MKCMDYKLYSVDSTEGSQRNAWTVKFTVYQRRESQKMNALWIRPIICCTVTHNVTILIMKHYRQKHYKQYIFCIGVKVLVLYKMIRWRKDSRFSQIKNLYTATVAFKFPKTNLHCAVLDILNFCFNFPKMYTDTLLQ